MKGCNYIVNLADCAVKGQHYLEYIAYIARLWCAARLCAKKERNYNVPCMHFRRTSHDVVWMHVVGCRLHSPSKVHSRCSYEARRATKH